MQEGELDLRQVLARLWSSRWLIVAGTVVPALCAALLSAFLLPKAWEARALLMVTVGQVQTVDPANPAIRVGGDLNVVAVLRPELTADGLVALARSPAVTAEVGRRTGLSAAWLEKRLRATVVRGTNLVELRVRAFDRESAGRIAAVWTDVLVERSRRAFEAQAGEVYRSFAGELQKARTALERADVELKEFVSRSRIGELQARLAKLTDQLATYEVRANDLDVALVRAEAELRRLADELRQRPQKLVLERSLGTDPFLLQVASETSGNSPTRVAGLRMRVEEQNPVFNSVSQSYATSAVAVAALRAEKGRVESRMAALRDEVARVRAQLAAEQLEETQLRRRVDTARRVYDALLQRREEARIAASSRLGTVEIVAAAAAGEEPVSPRPGLNAALAATLGFLAAVFGVLVRDAWAAAPEQGGVARAVPEPHGR